MFYVLSNIKWKILEIFLYIIITFIMIVVYMISVILKYIGIIITLIFLIWFWIWILNQIFSQLKIEVKRKSLLWWALLVLALAFYDWIFDVVWIDKWMFYLRDVFNFNSVALFVVYWLVVLLIITLLFRNIKNKKLLLEILVAILSLIIFAFFWWKLWLTVLVLYYILAAFTEEMFKFTVSNNQSQKLFDKNVSLLLFLSVIIWITFSICENIYSFVIQLFNDNLSVWFILGRGLIASLIHCVSTWAIAVILMKIKKWSLIFRYFIALLVGSLIHIIYNLSIVNNLTWVIFLLVIVALVFLSYLFFNMDEIYNK